MKKIVVIVALALFMAACSSHKKNIDSTAGRQPGISVAPVQKKEPQGIDGAIADKLVKEARKWIGTKYKYGGQSRSGTDCSGMVMTIFNDVAGIKLPRDSRSQQQYCKPLDKKKLAPGDLVFFCTGSDGSRVNHVGLYIGGGDFIHSSTSKGVIVSNMSQDYYARHFHSAGRVAALEK